MATDANDGVILGWSTVESPCLQRLDSLGERCWGDSGVLISNRTGSVGSGEVAVASDGRDGAVVTWLEGAYPHYRAYAQHLDALGRAEWPVDGIRLSDSSLDVIDVNVSSDNRDREIVNWAYAGASGRSQRLGASGDLLWGSDGVPITTSGAGGRLRNTPDGCGGVFIGHGMRIHHLDSLGTKVWGDSGAVYLALVDTNVVATHSSQAVDGNGGVFNFMEFYPSPGQVLIQAQWIDARGVPRFGVQGRPVTSPDATNQFWPTASSDGRGGAIVSWNQFQGGYSSVYVARVDSAQSLVSVEWGRVVLPSHSSLYQNYPNPFNPETVIQYSVSGRMHAKLSVFDVLGRELTILVDETVEPGEHSIHLEGRNLATGVYFYRLSTPSFTMVRKMVVVR
jgi:hypothetical protein